jgi:hypothetical protein
MILAISRFRIANEMQHEVEEAFVNRPHLVDTVPGFHRPRSIYEQGGFVCGVFDHTLDGCQLLP